MILALTDDRGYGDLRCHGNPAIETPNLDRLHGESVRFTNFHVDPVCAPARAAITSSDPAASEMDCAGVRWINIMMPGTESDNF